jgi:hypothetical protein
MTVDDNKIPKISIKTPEIVLFIPKVKLPGDRKIAILLSKPSENEKNSIKMTEMKKMTNN